VTEVGRPVPIPDDLSRAFWDAAAAHSLVLARCTRCSRFSHPPDTVCPHCGSTDPAFESTAVDGSGSIRSWTIMRQSFLPGFDVPFVLVDVELSAQPEVRLIGRLVDGPDAPLHFGAPVRLTFEDIAPDVAVPAFELDVGS
jgi:uncharacterized OB-fold protein